MKKEEIIEILKSYSGFADRSRTDTVLGECNFEIVANKILTLQQNQTKDNWVSVEERLPENSGEFIVLTVDLDIDFDEYVIEKYGFDWYGKLVTHWQPLPEPPVNK